MSEQEKREVILSDAEAEADFATWWTSLPEELIDGMDKNTARLSFWAGQVYGLKWAKRTISGKGGAQE